MNIWRRIPQIQTGCTVKSYLCSGRRIASVPYLMPAILIKQVQNDLGTFISLLLWSSTEQWIYGESRMKNEYPSKNNISLSRTLEMSYVGFLYWNTSVILVLWRMKWHDKNQLELVTVIYEQEYNFQQSTSICLWYRYYSICSTSRSRYNTNSSTIVFCTLSHANQIHFR